MNEQIKHVLWTGGWDSTFRILYLCFVDKVPVVPHYIIDTNRPSWHYEIKAIKDISCIIRQRLGANSQLLKQTQFIGRWELDPSNKAKEQLAKLRQYAYFGDQYIYICSYSTLFSSIKFELCIGRDDESGLFLTHHTKQGLSNEPHRISNNLIPELSLLTKFDFPLLALSKQEMLKTSSDKDFLSVLTNSWFCYRPIRHKPCGVCTPCVGVIKSGMSWRMGRKARLLGAVKFIYTRLFQTVIKTF